MSWYRQYRPITLAGLHLVSVRETLQQLLGSGQFPHALLFAGPKGTGKTSAARIVGAILNDPANAEFVQSVFFGGKKKSKAVVNFQEPNPSDPIVQQIQRGTSYVVIELDAASHRGIDDIRQLKERVHLPPAEGLIALYILDEAHMLTTEAFNALLKLLEEPPPHAVFILATTELHKIPETIISRCAVVQFHKASDEELRDALKHILDAEKISFEDEALREIVTAADGSFRDGVKLLEMVAGGQARLTLVRVQEMLKTQGSAEVVHLLQLIVGKDAPAVTQFFAELRTKDTDPTYFHKTLLQFLHSELLLSLRDAETATQFSPKILHYLLSHFNVVKPENDIIPFLSLELKALELIFKAKEKNGGNGSGSSEPQPELKKQKTETVPSSKLQAQGEVESPGFTQGQFLLEKWEEFLLKVHQRNSSIGAVLRSAKPLAAEGEKAKIEVYYQFHREQLLQPKFRSMLDECVEDMLGAKVFFEFTLAVLPTQDSISPLTTPATEKPVDTFKLAKELLM